VPFTRKSATKKSVVRATKTYRHWEWITNQIDVTFVLSFIFLFCKLLNMFRATMCPSSGADDCVVLSPRVGIVPWLQEGCQNRLVGGVSIEMCWYCAVAAGRLSEPVDRWCVHWDVLVLCRGCRKVVRTGWQVCPLRCVGIVPWLQEGCQNRLVGGVSIELCWYCAVAAVRLSEPVSR